MLEYNFVVVVIYRCQTVDWKKVWWSSCHQGQEAMAFWCDQWRWKTKNRGWVQIREETILCWRNFLDGIDQNEGNSWSLFGQGEHRVWFLQCLRFLINWKLRCSITCSLLTSIKAKEWPNMQLFSSILYSLQMWCI